MNEILNDQQTIRHYLLGNLPEAEKAALEDRFLGGEEIFEQIEDGENDLVDDYVAGRLAIPERQLFESYYLASSEKRTKVETARVLRREQQSEKTQVVKQTVSEFPSVDQPGFWESIQNFFAAGRLVPVAGFAVLLILIGSLWFAFRTQPNNEIVYSPTPAPANIPLQPSPALGTNNNASVNTNQILPGVSPSVPRNVNNAPPETPRVIEPKTNVSPTPRQTPAPQSTVTLALIAGLVRGEREANKLVLPKNVNQIRLTFDLPSRKYKEIEARIETVAGAQVWSGKIKQTGGRVALQIPARIFGDEDYLLILSGADEAEKRIDFSQFYFNSERK